MKFQVPSQIIQVFQKIDPKYFENLGIKDYFYVATTPATFIGGNFIPESAAKQFEEQRFLDRQVLPEKEIVNHQDQKVFRIYHFSL